MLWQENATLYEKLVFDAFSYLISEDRDDDVAVEMHSKVSGVPLNNRICIVCIAACSYITKSLR